MFEIGHFKTEAANKGKVSHGMRDLGAKNMTLACKISHMPSSLFVTQRGLQAICTT